VTVFEISEMKDYLEKQELKWSTRRRTTKHVYTQITYCYVLVQWQPTARMESYYTSIQAATNECQRQIVASVLAQL